MSRRRQHSLVHLVVASLITAALSVPTPLLKEVVTCPYQSVCMPREACHSSNVTFDAQNNNGFNSGTVTNGTSEINKQHFACGVLEESAGHVCCALSSDTDSGQQNVSVPAVTVTPGPDFQPSTGAEARNLSEENPPTTESLPNANPKVAISNRNLTASRTVVLPAKVIDEISFRSAENNAWPCGEVLSPSALNETYTVEEKPIHQGYYPWQVAVLTADMLYMCGGALVGSSTVLTLASCINNVTADHLLIRVGDLDLSSDWEPLPAYDVPVNSIAKYPGFDPTSRQFDMAVLQLEHSVSSLPYARAACLPLSNPNIFKSSLNHLTTGQSVLLDQSTTSATPDLAHCHLASWGLEASEQPTLFQGKEGSFSYTLRGGHFYVLSRAACQVILGENETLAEDEQCAAGYGGTAICRGGGGSALVCRAGDRFVLEGIIARDIGCSRNTPLVYIKITDHLNFILDNLLLSSAIEEESTQAPTPTSDQGFFIYSDGKTAERPSEKPSGSNNRNDVVERFPNAGDQGNGEEGIPSWSPGSTFLQGPPPSTNNNVGNDRKTFGNVQSDVGQSNLFHFGEVIVPGGSGQQHQSGGGGSGSTDGGGSRDNTNTFINGQMFNNPTQNNNQHLSFPTESASLIQSDPPHSVSQVGFSHSNNRQDVNQYVSGGVFSPSTVVQQHDINIDQFSGGDENPNIFIGSNEISIPKEDVDPSDVILDLGNPDLTHRNPNHDGYLLDSKDHNSDQSVYSNSETVFDLGNPNFKPSIVYAPVTEQSSFETEKLFSKPIYGSFVDDLHENRPQSQFDETDRFHGSRPTHFPNRPIHHRGFRDYEPIKYPLPHQERHPRWEFYNFHYPRLPPREYRPPRPVNRYPPPPFHHPPPHFPRPRPFNLPPPRHLPINTHIGRNQPSGSSFQQFTQKLPLEPPPRRNPQGEASFQQFTPMSTTEPPPNPPPFFNSFSHQQPPIAAAEGSGFVSNKIPLGPQNPSPVAAPKVPPTPPDATKPGVPEITENSNKDLDKVNLYLSQFQ